MSYFETKLINCLSLETTLAVSTIQGSYILIIYISPSHEWRKHLNKKRHISEYAGQVQTWSSFEMKLTRSSSVKVMLALSTFPRETFLNPKFRLRVAEIWNMKTRTEWWRSYRISLKLNPFLKKWTIYATLENYCWYFLQRRMAMVVCRIKAIMKNR